MVEDKFRRQRLYPIHEHRYGLLRMLRMVRAYLSVLSVMGPLINPQSPVLFVSYAKDPRANFVKFQNSGADEKILMVHNSAQLYVFYSYLIRIPSYHYAVYPQVEDRFVSCGSLPSVTAVTCLLRCLNMDSLRSNTDKQRAWPSG